MKVGPKFKLARRLGQPVFDKTQGQKFQLNQEKKSSGKRRGKAPSEYGLQLKEKQKARYSYLVPERQFANYVHDAMRYSHDPAQTLFERLEMRLDNVAYRLGMAPTKSAARQLVSHGHVTVNGRKMKTPSHKVAVGDTVAVREGSKNTGLFTGLAERLEHYNQPSWLSFDMKTLSGTVDGVPQLKDHTDLLFDVRSILEFYSR